VQPVSDISELRTPLDGLRRPNDIEEFLGGMIEGRPVARLKNHGMSDDTIATSPADDLSEAGGLAADYGYTLN